jgi:multimeric flavodoxin WrbA
MIRVVAFNGSSRKDGNTAILLKLVLDELKKADRMKDWQEVPIHRNGVED